MTTPDPDAALFQAPAPRSGFWSSHQRHILFGLKSSNLGLITLFQFLLIFTLTRTVGAEVYPIVVLLASVGNYILGTDLGFSAFVYSHIRERFVRREMTETHEFINSSINLYLAIPTIALIGAAIIIPATVHQSGHLVLALVVYFASIIFSLPWQMMRSIMMAIDGFMMMETLELVRRLVMVLLVVSMLLGLPFTVFAFACMGAWVMAFGSAFIALGRRGIRLHVLTPRKLVSFSVGNRRNVARTGAFGGMEFVLYNFPYLLIPALGLGGHTLVFFDLFYKLTRFAGVAFAVPIETLLPFQTRAWHEGRLPEVRKLRRQMLLLCLPIFAIASILLLFFGRWFFHVLLHGYPTVNPGLVYAMVAMMFFIMLQATTGTFLGSIGRFDTLVRIGTFALALALVVAGLGFFFRIGAGPLLVVYVIGYGVYAFIYRNSFSRLLRNAETSRPASRS